MSEILNGIWNLVECEMKTCLKFNLVLIPRGFDNNVILSTKYIKYIKKKQTLKVTLYPG